MVTTMLFFLYHSSYTPVLLLQARKHITLGVQFWGKKYLKAYIRLSNGSLWKTVCGTASGMSCRDLLLGNETVISLHVIPDDFAIGSCQCCQLAAHRRLVLTRRQTNPCHTQSVLGIQATWGQCWACTLCLLLVTETKTKVSTVRGQAFDGESNPCFWLSVSALKRHAVLKTRAL